MVTKAAASGKKVGPPGLRLQQMHNGPGGSSQPFTQEPLSAKCCQRPVVSTLWGETEAWANLFPHSLHGSASGLDGEW